tara:strand:+ start:227 stop:841 length:615 start_codon:yes stop_codon:yes gene_type:complete
VEKNILKQSIDFLVKDKKLKTLIEKYPYPRFKPDDNYFNALSKSIIYQQLSGKVAKIIYNRFLALFKKEIPKPEQYLGFENHKLKSIGLSKQKIDYIKNVSNFFIKDGYNINFKTESEKEIGRKLIKIKGIGQWTVDMFMMFTLCKTDILPVGDLGIKNAFKELYNLKELPSEGFMLEKALAWKPYRTIACCYLWMIVDDGDVW